jgi:hypothetical protein
MRHLFLGVIALCFAVSFMLSFFKISRSSQRRIYWGSACIASASGVLMTHPTWKDAVLLGIAPLAVMAFAAYAYTPYIKIGGRIYALTVDNSQADPDDASLTAQAAHPESDPAPDSYGGLLTAAKTWWLLVVIAVIAAGNVYIFVARNGGAGVAATMATFIVLLAVVLGDGDGSWGYRIARGQHLLFGVASVLTAGGFALLYLIAYYAARRRPLRHTQSMEYRAHHHHRQLP